MARYATALHAATPHEIAAFYAQDGQLLLPGMQPIAGPKGIEDFLAPMAASVEVTSVNVTSEVVEVHGAAANQWGTYEQVAGERGKTKSTYHGRYSAEWHRAPDGTWRIFRLMMQPL